MIPARRSATGDDEHGFSLIELTVVLTILSLVLFTLYGFLDSMAKNTARHQALVIDQESVRLVMLQMVRDIRSAEPIQPLATNSAYANQIDVTELNTDGTTTSNIRWQLSGTTLNRIILSGPGGTAVSTKSMLTNVTNTSSQPVFTYYTSTQNSTPVDLTSTDLLPGDIANCAIRVHIFIHASPQPGPLPFTEQSDAEIRNRLPGGIGC